MVLAIAASQRLAGDFAVPCYLFTYHAYGSWMPDNPRGYVKCGQGILSPDKGMAQKYRANLAHDVVSFNEQVQRHLIQEALVACEHQQLRCHYIATSRRTSMCW